MFCVMGSLNKISKALDTKNIGEVLIALEPLDDVVFEEHQCEDSFVTFLLELISWDLALSPKLSEIVLRKILGFIKNKKTLQDMCETILKAQAPVAVQIAVEIMAGENWILSKDDCMKIWKETVTVKLQNVENKNVEEYASRNISNCKILRLSKVPHRFLSSMLHDVLKLLSNHRLNAPQKCLNELSLIFPFHPLLVMEDLKNTPDVFLIPHVMSNEYRFRLEVDDFIEFLASDSLYQDKQAQPALHVLRGIFTRMELIDELEAEDIERVVDLWHAAFRLFDGYGISLNDITESAKLLEKTTARFSIKRRPLFLKRFLRKLSEKNSTSIGLEPQIVATIITTFQRNAFGLGSSEFYEELGEFWTLCMKMKYDDVYYATVFYSSVFALAQAQAVFRVKKELCRAVYEHLLKPMHEQIVDFVRLKNVESNKIRNSEQDMIMEQQNLGSSYFSILTCTYKNAEERILEFINDS